MATKVKRITKFIVYVGAGELKNPVSLCDAAMAHLIKKNYPIDKRKKFLALFMKAVGHKAQMAVIDAWVQVRDIATFPYRNKKKDECSEVESNNQTSGEEADEDSETEGGVSLDDGADGKSESGAASK